VLAACTGSAATAAALASITAVARQAAVVYPVARPQRQLSTARARRAPTSPAARLTVYAETTLTPQVVRLEQALATANQGVQAYCAARRVAFSLCFDQDVEYQSADTEALSGMLDQQAHVLTAVSAALSLLPHPVLGADGSAQQMERLIEDLTLVTTQATVVLEEHAEAIGRMRQSVLHGPQVSRALQGLGYAPRVRSLGALLRRAEGWLETMDRETGAHARLPGFAPGAPPIEAQVGLP
jgi:hypothetical protein